MEKTLLFEAFASLSTAELREFGKFVRSPFFNTRPQLVALYDYLVRCREDGVPPLAEMAYAAIHPNLSPSGDATSTVALGATSPLPLGERLGVGWNQKLRLAQSALLALLEHYWMYREKFGDPDRARIRLAAAYRKRNLDKHFQIALREARQGRERLPWRHADFFHDMSLLEWEQYQYETSTRRTESLNLQAPSDHMDTAFVSRKLRLACLALSHQAVFKTEYRIGLLAPVLEHVESARLMDIPAVGLYYYCYKFLADVSPDEHFDRFRSMLPAHAAALPPDELRTLHLLAINFGIKKINESSAGWMQATLDLYKSALERDLMLENGVLSRFAFNNIAAIALRLGELDWAESFVLRYKPHLERHWREATAGLNLARIAYARRDYKTALLNLQRSDYKDLINNLIAKTLQLKIYYETAEYDLLESHLASMKNFIRRHTAIGYHRTNYSHIVQYTRQLMALNFNNPKAVAELRAQIEREEILTEKEWLLEMVGQEVESRPRGGASR
ncbi:MAG: hypothetical protein KA165_04895 [Saprospiraceae bacterium]|nr:hypothetical protein [Saprospiraceae bacterium]